MPSRHIRYLWNSPDWISFDPQLDVSLTKNCAFCRLLAHSLGKATTVTGLHFADLGDTLTLEWKSTQSLCVKACVGYETGKRIAPLGEDAFRLSSRKCSYARRLKPDLADRSVMKSWLQICQTAHTRCMKYEKTMVKMPISRCLVDVKAMCVVDVGTRSFDYFALSYVWGKAQTLQLLRGNWHLLTEPGYLQSNYSELSSVVKDAIAITKELGHRFLWVDSLCICQDDAESKYYQMSNMNHIYKQAVATLVALQTKDS